MPDKNVNTRIRHRNAIKSQWTIDNPILLKGEIGLEIDTGKFKAGDGTNRWNSLPYLLSDSIETAQAAITALQSEATAKWVLLNTVDTRSTNNATNITSLSTEITKKQDHVNGGIYTLASGSWTAIDGMFQQIISVPNLPMNTPTSLDYETAVGPTDYTSIEPWGKFGVGLYAQPAGQLVFRAKKQPDVAINGMWSYRKCGGML